MWGTKVMFANEIRLIDLNDLALEIAAEWYNSKTTQQLIKYATSRQLNIGQNDDQLLDDWNTMVTEEKRREIMAVLQ